jgi:hypothetical protein
MLLCKSHLQLCHGPAVDGLSQEGLLRLHMHLNGLQAQRATHANKLSFCSNCHSVELKLLLLLLILHMHLDGLQAHRITHTNEETLSQLTSCKSASCLRDNHVQL